MSDSLNIIIGSKIDQSTEAVKNVEEQIKQMSGKIKEAISLKLKIDASQLEILTNKIEETKENLRTQNVVKESIFINPKVEQQTFANLLDKIKDIRKNIDEFAKVDIKTDKMGHIETATLTYYNKELKQTVTETMGWSSALKEVNGEMIQVKTFETQGLKFSDDMARARTETENLAKALKDFKDRMMGINGLKGELDLFAKSQKGKFDVTALDRIRTQIDGLNVNTPNLKDRIKELSTEFSLLGKSAEPSGNVLVRTFENAYKFLRYYLVGGILVSFIKGIKDAVKVVIELDTALTELNKVADLTGAELEVFTQKAYNAGVAIGRTGKEVINATAEFKRAGYELKEAFNLSQQALLLTNIGDGITDVREASSSLIAILKGFKKEASETAYVVDALNEVSNNFAVDTNNLTEIMKRVSGTIAQTGTSYEQLLGLATGGFESLRNAEMVASGINMITMRLKGMKEDGEEVVDLIPKIQEAFDKYTYGAVSIIDKQNGGLNSTFEILQQLSKIYPTLTDEAKAYINEAVAGTRQNKVLVSIMENWGNVEKAIQSATNSLGSAEKENEKYLNSINGKIKQLSSSTQLLWKNTVSSDLIKGIVDISNGVVKITDKIGLLNVALLITIGYLSIIKGYTLVDLINNTIAVVLKLTTAIGGLNLALGNFLPLIIATGIIIAIKAFDRFNVTLEEQREKVAALSDELSNLQSEYDKLNSTENRTTEQEKYLQLLEKEKEIKQDLLKTETERAVQMEYFTPTTSKYKSDLGIADTGERSIKNTINELKELESQLSSIVSKKSYDEINEKILKNKQFLIDSRKTIQGYIDDYKKAGEIPPIALTNLANAIDEVILKNNELAESTDKATKSNYNYKQSYEELNKTFETSTSNLIAYNDMIQELEKNHKLSAENVNKIFKDYPQLLAYLGSEQELREQLIKLKDEEAKKQREVYIQMIQDSEEFYNLRIKGNTELTNEIKDKYDIDLKNFRTLAEAKEKIESTLLNSLSQKWGLYFDATRNALTTDYTELMRVNPDMAKQVYGDVVKYFRTGSEFNDIVGKFIESDFSALNLSKTGNDSSKTDYEKPYEKQYQIIRDLNFELSKQNEILQQKEGLDQIPILSDINDKLETQKSNLHALNEERRKELDSLSKITDRTEEQEDRYQDLLEKIQDTSLEWWKLDNQQKSHENTIKKIREEQEKLIENQIKEQVELEKKLKLQEAENTLKQDLIDLEKEIYGTTQKAWEEASNARIEELEDELELLDKKNEKEKEAEERSKKLLEIQQQQEKLNNIKKDRNVRMLTETGWQWVADPRKILEETNTLKDLQTDFDNWEEQNRLNRKRKKIQDQIEEERELQKIKKQSYDKQKEDLENAYKLQKIQIDVEYRDIDSIVAERMEDIKATQNEKLGEMLTDAYDRLKELKRLYNQALDLQAKIEEIEIKSSSSGTNFRDIVLKGNPKTFDTGGFTGNSKGLAWLDEKEIILNKLDTENLLKAINLTRNLVQNFKLPQLSMANANNNSATANHFHFNNMTIKTENATSFINELKTLVHTYK